jgi:hypothetical protein
MLSDMAKRSGEDELRAAADDGFFLASWSLTFHRIVTAVRETLRMRS